MLLSWTSSLHDVSRRLSLNGPMHNFYYHNHVSSSHLTINFLWTREERCNEVLLYVDEADVTDVMSRELSGQPRY